MSVGEALINDPALELDNTKDDFEKEEINQAAALATEVKMVPLVDIVKSEVALRDVQRQTESYQLLVNSIKSRGVLNSILVRKLELPGGITRYSLIDGLQRFNAAGDAGITHIPARIVEMDDAEVLEAQIITNMNRVLTRPADLSKHLLRILMRNPFMTLDQLAERVCQSRTWIEQRLSLNKLLPDIQKLVNEEKIHLTNAYALSKIPAEEQAEHVQASMEESPKTFVPRMKDRVKAIKDAKHSGKDAGKAEFQPAMHVQKVGILKDEYKALIEGEGESQIKVLIAKNKITDPVDAAKVAVAWVLSYDEESKAKQIERHRVMEEQRKEKSARLREEKERLKSEESAQKAADITSL